MLPVFAFVYRVYFTFFGARRVSGFSILLQCTSTRHVLGCFLFRSIHTQSTGNEPKMSTPGIITLNISLILLFTITFQSVLLVFCFAAYIPEVPGTDPK